MSVKHVCVCECVSRQDCVSTWAGLLTGPGGKRKIKYFVFQQLIASPLQWPQTEQAEDSVPIWHLAPEIGCGRSPSKYLLKLRRDQYMWIRFSTFVFVAVGTLKYWKETPSSQHEELTYQISLWGHIDEYEVISNAHLLTLWPLSGCWVDGPPTRLTWATDTNCSTKAHLQLKLQINQIKIINMKRG